ncbi:MAG: CrcB family protein, partial [Saprospiraceae bacterium]|nr:CrcB family protein [Saprospiraceae bacterium]
MNHFYAFLLVFAGGGTGSMVRYAISLLVGPIQNRFPWATMASNVLACLVLGWTLGTFWAGGMSDQRKL